jgi:hypothetical protein
VLRIEFQCDFKTVFGVGINPAALKGDSCVTKGFGVGDAFLLKLLKT